MKKITSFFKKSSSDNKMKRSDSTDPSEKEQKQAKRQKVDLSQFNLLDSLTEESWRLALSQHFGTTGFRNLVKFISQERRNQTIYPKIQDTWTALNVCPLNKVRVVIVGQDPYHGPHQAHGLCFSVLPGQAPPPSLKNMYKELMQDQDITNFPQTRPNHGHLLRWAQQGVLLLNTVLTVRRGQANSHKKRGWEQVTDEIIRAVDRNARARKQGVVFLLWGNPAKTKALQLIGSEGSSLHTVICTSHPSPLGASKTKSPFLGSQCFSRCNHALVEMNHQPVDWNIDGPLPEAA